MLSIDMPESKSPDYPRGKPGKPLQISGPWRVLADAAGSLRALAAEIGVDETTVWKWIHGKRKPSSSAKKVVEMVSKKHKVPNPLAPQGIPAEAVQVARRRPPSIK